MAGSPIYLRSLEKLGVQDTIARMGPLNKNVTINSNWVPLDSLIASEDTEDVVSATNTYLDGFVSESSFRVKTRSHYWNLTGEPVKTAPLDSRAYFQTMTGLESEVVYSEGSHPTANVEVDEDGTRIVEVAVYGPRAKQRKHGADILDLEVGDVFDVVSEPRGVDMVRARVTGIFRERDRNSDFWMGFPTAFLDPPPITAFPERDFPLILFTEWDSLLSGVGPSNAGLPANFDWVFYTDAQALGESRVADMLARLGSLEDQLAKDLVRPNVITNLDPSFERLQEKITFVRIPMFLMAALTVVIVAYYLFLVSGILSKRRESDTVMLRSRGLSVWQVFRMEALEALLLIGLPVVVAPFVAAIVVWQMGRLPIFDVVTGGGVLPVELMWQAWAWAAGSGLIALLVLLLPALFAVRRGVSEATGSESRPDRAPLFQRYFLDVLFVVLGGLIFWELNSRGSVVAATREGERSADFTLLFAPAIFLLVVALVFLRLFPLAAKLLSSLAGKSGSASVSLGFWRLGRRPYWYSWPIMLLVLAGGLGVLAGTLASTLQRSSTEQILYETGADLHALPSGASETVNARDLEQIRAIEGVEIATPGMRLTSHLGTTSAGPQFQLLAVDGLVFPDVAWFRDDFSDKEIRRLLEQIHVPVKPEPLFLPEGATELRMWARQQPYVNDHFLWLILRDTTGRTTTVTMGQIGAQWSQQTAAIPDVLVHPVQLISIQTFMQAGGDGGAPTDLYLDDLVAAGPGIEQVVVSFDNPGLWTSLPTSNGLDTIYGLESEPAGVGQPGTSTAKVFLDRGTNSGIRGIYRTATGGPLPVISSETFLADTNSQVGLPFVAGVSGGFVPMVIVDTLRYFPTLDSDREPFIIADIGSLVDFLDLRGLRTAGANELFASIDTSRHFEIRDQIRGIFRAGRILDRQEMLDNTTVDPLAVAGWRGMGLVALLLTGIATTLGYITYLSAHSTRTEHDTAYMRAIGLSRRGFLQIVFIEHALVAVLGIALGVVTGIGVSRIAVDSMAFTETGDRLVPPFLLQTNWVPVAIILAVAVFTALVILAGLLRSYPRLPLHVLTRTRG